MPAPAQHTSFALAKIQPPRLRRDLVPRAALQSALLDALQSQRVTVVLAPAGYGKTTALAQQLAMLPTGCALAWISADESDHLQRFLECLTTALEPFDLPWRVAPEALALLAQSDSGLRDAAGELVNALAAAELPRGLIAIDDAHRITDPHVWQFVQAVAERLSAAWGLVLASRVEPPLPLARWRAMGELSEFRQHDLRFSADEVGALLARQPAAATALTAQELLARTDGWAAGLQLSLSARRHASTDSAHSAAAQRGGPAGTRHLFDYLASEVLRDMPPPLRLFLLRCSVLPELTAARCAYVSGDAQAAQ